MVARQSKAGPNGPFNKPNITRARTAKKLARLFQQKQKKFCQIANVFNNHFYKNHELTTRFVILIFWICL
jgi:hypothetical protein